MKMYHALRGAEKTASTTGEKVVVIKNHNSTDPEPYEYCFRDNLESLFTSFHIIRLVNPS